MFARLNTELKTVLCLSSRLLIHHVDILIIVFRSECSRVAEHYLTGLRNEYVCHTARYGSALVHAYVILDNGSRVQSILLAVLIGLQILHLITTISIY